MQQRLHKYQRQPARVAGREITDRSLAIIATIARYRFIPTSLLVPLVAGNEDVTHRHLQTLYHRGYVSRFAFPRNGFPGEFHYYLDNTAALELLVEHAGVSRDALDFDEVRRNREKAYAEIHEPTKAEDALGRLLFLKHEMVISRFHAMLELACRESDETVELAEWRQGSELWSTVSVRKLVRDQGGAWTEDEAVEKLPHRPDAFFTLRFLKEPEGQNRAHFFYEADRKRTATKKFKQKLRAHFHFIVRQRKHEEKYGIKRVRAVLIETTDTAWAEELREAARHRIVSGERPTSLFWFTASEVFTREREELVGKKTERRPRFLADHGLIFKPVWVSPVDDTLHSLLD